jgi:tetratricopeptide (TPR) repeat protein
MIRNEKAHRIHEAVEQVGSYFRFSLDPEMGQRDLDVGIEEAGSIAAQTGVYLRNPHTVKRIEDYVKVMTDESTAETLAVSHYAAGRYETAFELEVWVWHERNRRFGVAHADTIRARENLAVIMIEKSDWYGAGGQQWEAARYLRLTLGMDHPHAIQAHATLAAIYSHEDGLDNTGKLQLEILGQQRRIFGDDHVVTIRAAAALASTYHMLGRWSEAKRLRLEILERRRKILGEDHPDTVLAAECLDATLRAPEEVKAAQLWESNLKVTLQEPAKGRSGAVDHGQSDTS